MQGADNDAWTDVSAALDVLGVLLWRFLDAESSIAHATDGFPQGESSSLVAVHDVYDADIVPSSLQ